MKKNICKVYGSRVRVGLVVCLSTAKTVSQILAECTLSQSALSQHLKVLRDVGVVLTQRKGKNIFYKTKNKALKLAKLLLTYK